MKYPKFLKETNTIGTTALSDGIIDSYKQNRLDNAHKKLEEVGFSLVETENVRTGQKGRSSHAKRRAEEFHQLVEDEKIDAIIIAAGGDFLLETLPYIDFSKIAKHPKWIQGYSDPTGILFVITTKLDIATIYSHNVAAFGMEPWHSSIQDNIDILKGKEIVQNSFSQYEKEELETVTGLEGYHLDTPVEWKSLGTKKATIEGRFIGGCIDLLAELAGTPFDYTANFIEKYKDEGIIWFFDNCDLTNEDLVRVFWKFKVCGWFRHTKAILLGRSATDSSFYDISFHETLEDSLKDLGVPVIYDMDFGHIPPRMTIINGGYGILSFQENGGSIQFLYK